jgi:VanZ family protein
MTIPRSHELSRRLFLLVAVGSVLFTIYGSYVPFHYHHRPWSEVWGAFTWVWQHRVAVESRSDLLANLLLGVPLGFGLLGAVGRGGWWARLGVAMVLWPPCIAFAVLVEFGQLYFPGRTCSVTDMLAQSVGSALGMAGFLLVGTPITSIIDRIARHPRLGGAPGRWLFALTGFVWLVEWLPLDIVTSPATIYHRLSDGHATWVPFAEWSEPARRWAKIESWLGLMGLFLPVGLILGRIGWPTVLMLIYAATMAVTAEFGQMFVSRHPSTTDALVGFCTICSGSVLVNRAGAVPTSFLMGILLLTQAIIHWQPFDFRSPESSRFVMIPFADWQAKHYLGGLNDVLERLVMFSPWGVIVSVRCRRRGLRGCLIIALVVGFSVACVLEIGQGFLPNRVVSTTAMLLGAFGSFLGAYVTQRLLTPGNHGEQNDGGHE